ncbi:Alpha-N-methyltransferase NTM [Parasponia andersonii]|uniref:Alpha N-terminal protein methyltransferase 1 n=1 Tax=Parasponia andersonii TaxID=3476 RepID=A0A2P5DRX9_PARAD|nr:Alpha-N-methyltransferase NTM [Parasponia andersonii]
MDLVANSYVNYCSEIKKNEIKTEAGEKQSRTVNKDMLHKIGKQSLRHARAVITKPGCFMIFNETIKLAAAEKLPRIVYKSLREFTPDAGRYDVIWVQWCIGHLTDDDLVSFFKRAKGGLKPGGFFLLKENIARNGFVLDNIDRSVTRSDSYFKELFRRCGLHIYKSKDQKGLPEELFAVKMYALTTDLPKKVHHSRSKVRANRPGIIR